MLAKATAVLLGFLWASSSLAADRWVVGGLAMPQCPAIATVWTLEAIAYNPLDYPQSLRLLGVSNGGGYEGVDPIETLEPGKMLSVPYRWRPKVSQTLWVTHLEVPEGIELAGVMYLGETQCTLPPEPERDAVRGTASVPVFDSLHEANQPHVHLTTGLGQLRHRTNVAVYNHSAEEASATIEQYNSSSGALVGAASVRIPARTIVQVPALRLEDPVAGTPQGVKRWLHHVIVRMDQPGFSFVSNLAEDHPIRSLIQVR
jgi:hypothetical protein